MSQRATATTHGDSGARRQPGWGFELGWGIALLCFGVTPYFNAAVMPWIRVSPWLAWINFLPLLCAAFAPYAVPKLIKRFITWPRTGYVANLNELKLKQLIMLMIFGSALGGSIGLLLILVVEVLEGLGHPGAPGDLAKLLLRRHPVPAAETP